MAAAIPDGVPVAITSPGSSVHACDRISTWRKQSKMSWLVFDCWRSSPLTNVRIASWCGSPISSGVTIQGPSGPCVSKDLASDHCGVWICQSRTLTSSTIR